MKITLDTDRLKSLIAEGSDIVMSADAEDALLEILDARDKVEKIYQEAKTAIEEAALKYNPNFKSVQADRIKVGYRSFGSRYAIDEAHFDELPAAFYKKSIKFTADSKAIDDYLKKSKALPLGIMTVDRKPQITIKLIEDFENED